MRQVEIVGIEESNGQWWDGVARDGMELNRRPWN